LRMRLLDRLALHRRARRRHVATFRRAGLPAPKVRFLFSQSGIFPYEARIHREKDSFVVDIMGSDIPLAVNAAAGRVEAFLYWFSQCPQTVQSIHFDFSDGEFSTGGTFSPCSSNPAKILLPDPYFFQRRGFADARNIAENAKHTWLDR